MTLYPVLAAIGQSETEGDSEEMQQVLRPLKARDGALLQEAQLLLQQLNEAACLWSEQWMHILRDVQVLNLPVFSFLHMIMDQTHDSSSGCEGIRQRLQIGDYHCYCVRKSKDPFPWLQADF